MIFDIFEIWSASPGPAAFWTGIGFLAGAYINHRYAVKRDRDKEFNALADVVRNQLRRELADIRYSFRNVDGDSLKTLIDMSSAMHRRRLSKAVAAYKQARNQHTERNLANEQLYTRTDHIEKAGADLLRLLKRR